MNMRSPVRLAIALLASYGAGFLGSLFTADGVRTWYATIEKPSFTPPDWLFAPVWFTFYGLMAIALYRIWVRDPHAKDMRGWVPLFFVHLLLNAAWSIFFFGFHAIFIGLIDIVLLDVCVALLIVGAYDIDKRSAYLLLPYLAWILFATALNAGIWILN